MYARVLPKNVMHCRECFPFLGINRKRLCQTLSSVDSSVICPLIWMFTSIRSYRKINKLLTGHCDYIKMIAPRAMTNFWENKAKQTFM